MKTYELTIMTWHAAIPMDWPLEVEMPTDDPTTKEFVLVSGKEIRITQGTKLRGGPQELFDNMLRDKFVKEVTEPERFDTDLAVLDEARMIDHMADDKEE